MLGQILTLAGGSQPTGASCWIIEIAFPSGLHDLFVQFVHNNTSGRAPMIAVRLNAHQHYTGMPLEPAFPIPASARTASSISGSRWNISRGSSEIRVRSLHGRPHRGSRKELVCVYMHVGVLAVILEIFEFPYRVLLGHDVIDLQFELSRKIQHPAVAGRLV